MPMPATIEPPSTIPPTHHSNKKPYMESDEFITSRVPYPVCPISTVRYPLLNLGIAWVTAPLAAMMEHFHVVEEHIVSIRAYYDPRPLLEGMQQKPQTANVRFTAGSSRRSPAGTGREEPHMLPDTGHSAPGVGALEPAIRDVFKRTPA